MKKILILALALCMCFSFSAMAETAAVAPEAMTFPVEFEAVDITVESAAIGFQVPADFVAVEVTPEQAEQGLLLNAADAAQTYSLQVTLNPADVTTFEATVAGTEGVTNVMHVTINEKDFLTYEVAANNTTCFVSYVNDSAVLVFSVIVPEGVDPGTVPVQIVGSLYDL